MWKPKVIDEYGGIDYRRWDYVQHAHYVRYKAHVETKGNGFVCQECGGAGGEVEPVLDDGSGPWMGCGFCEGTGLVTRWMRGWWLRWKAIEKQERRAKAVKAGTNARGASPSVSA